MHKSGLSAVGGQDAEASDLIPPAPGNNPLRVIPLAPVGFPAAHAQKYMEMALVG